MLRVSDTLWVCECDATGWAANLKGAVEEARRLIWQAGGADKIIEQRRERNKAKREQRLKLKAVTKEMYDKYGYYEAMEMHSYGELQKAKVMEQQESLQDVQILEASTNAEESAYEIQSVAEDGR